MRELKFRVWDEKYHCWDNSLIICYPNEVFKKQGRTIQQYTGLTDSKGKEIYEGDIIKETHFEDWKDDVGYDYFGVVEHVVHGDYVNQFSKYSSFPKLEERTGYAGNPISVKCKVIGNIFGFPCRPDHNSGCVTCDRRLSDCPAADLVQKK